MTSSLLDVTFFGFVASGTPLFWIFINSWLLFLVIEVNHDGSGGTAPDAMVWDRGGIVKPSAPSSFRLIVDHATLPGPPRFLG